jgi:hypothetical protein
MNLSTFDAGVGENILEDLFPVKPPFFVARISFSFIFGSGRILSFLTENVYHLSSNT